MDYILDILLPKSDTNKVSLSEMLVEWAGGTFSQEPLRYTYKSKLYFTEQKNREYYKRYVVNRYNNYEFIALHFDGTLLDLELLINNNGNFIENDLILFLMELVKLETFAILLMRDEECVDERYEISKEEELYAILRDSLSWMHPKGVLITDAHVAFE